MFNKRQSPLENKLTNSCQEILEVSAACNHVTLRDEIQKEVSFHFVFQSLSHVRLFVTPWTAAHQASLSFAISQSLLKLMSIELMRPFHPLSPPSPPAFSLYQHQSFPMNWLFASGGQSIGASALVLPVNIQGWLPLRSTGSFLLSEGLSRVFSRTTVRKH